ncbi:MAG: alpha-N-acetylglucosaminidase [Kiritimatiellae bacterium]|nr:alpha-N-acetylglucosaminidase [Kiritimatiellia bacterium]
MNAQVRRLAMVTAAVLSSGSLLRASEPAAIATSRALLERWAPGRSAEFSIELIPPADGGHDVFEVAGAPGRVILRGNTPVAIASAFRRYLADGGWGHFSRCGVRLDLPHPLPPPRASLRVVSPFPVRFAYNFCTLSYTFAWSDIAAWERELDLLALHGYNAALVLAGVEQTWSDTLTQFGYTEDEARAWLVWPSHQAWQQMSNLERFDGPLPASVVRQRLELGRFIVRRMRELGMEPVLPGYYGMVPTDFGARHPDAAVLGQGSWAGGFLRPHMVSPVDPLFAQVADAFHAAQKKHFGPIRFWAGDPFHEGGSAGGVDLPAAGRAIQDAFLRANPESVWMLQAWGGNPKRALMERLDPEHVLVIDLGCERVENWRGSDAFWGFPWIWSIIMNFGGNSGLDHRIETLTRVGPASWNDSQRRQFRGVAITPEGVDTLPWIWDLAADQNWSPAGREARAWAADVVRVRYGSTDPALVAAWVAMIELAGHSSTSEMPHLSILCARPSLDPELKARTWGSTKYPYPPELLLAAWEGLLSATPAGAPDPYRYDIVDWGRQVLGDYARTLHARLVSAAARKDAAELRALADELLALCDDLDQLLATRSEFLLGRWLRDARAWGATDDERDVAERNARRLVTTWGDRVSNLNDYSAREWSGLMRAFYRPRWAMFLSDLVRAAEAGEAFQPGPSRDRIAAWELEWSRSSSSFAPNPSGDEQAVARALLEKYAPRIRAAANPSRPDLLAIAPDNIVGAWSYPAHGRTYTRVFRADGTCELRENGKPTSHFAGFRWTVEGRMAIIVRSNGSICERHGLTDRDTMIFTVEPWGPAKREPDAK